MTDEEKTVLEFIKINNKHKYCGKDDVDFLLNLIEKQQKEIEKLKDKYSDEKIRNTVIKRFNEVIEKDYVSKDKIKAKIEECEKEKNIPQEMDFKAFYRIKDLKNIEIEVLQSLLEKE